MNDHELQSLVGAVRALMDQRDTAQRAIVESLKADVAALRAEVKQLSGADARAETLLRSFAEQTGAALPLAITGAVDRLHGKLATRVAVLERRMPTEAAQ